MLEDADYLKYTKDWNINFQKVVIHAWRLSDNLDAV